MQAASIEAEKGSSASNYAPTADEATRRLLIQRITREDLSFVHGFLINLTDYDKVKGHTLVKAIHACGAPTFPTVWRGVMRHIGSHKYRINECELQDRLALGSTRMIFRPGDIVLHERTQRYAEVVASRRESIHLRNETLEAQIRKDVWHEFIQPIYFARRS